MPGLPPRWDIERTEPNKRNRGRCIIYTPDGLRISVYDNGGVRVYREDHDAEVRTANRAESGTNVNIEFTPRQPSTS